jgi:hypothetical protein
MNSITRELLAYLDEQRSILQSAFDSVPVDLRERPPAPDRWSATNVVEHLAIVEARVANLLTERIKEELPGLQASKDTGPILPTIDYQKMYDRSNRVKAPEVVIPTGVTAASAWMALEKSGSMLRALLVGYDAVDLSPVKHAHPRFGSLSVYEWMAFLGAHEVRHAAQIREDNSGAAKAAN